MNSVHCSKCVCVPTAPGVCTLGWVKCREQISLLVKLCIIMYVTTKKKNNNSKPIFFFFSKPIMVISNHNDMIF